MMLLCCGASYTRSLYATFENGKFRSVPTDRDILQSLRWAHSAGFHNMELEVLTIRHFKETFGDPYLLSFASTAKELEMNVPMVYFLFMSDFFASDELRRTGLRVFRQCLDVVLKLDATTAEMTSPPFPNTELFWDTPYPGGPPSGVLFHPADTWSQTWTDYVQWVGDLSDMAAGYGVKIAIEPRPREMLSNTESLLTLLHDVSSSNVGAVFDTGHHFAMKEILPISIWKMGKTIFAVHLTDNDGLIEHQWAPGEGKIDWPSVLEALNRAEFRGPLAIESSGAGLREADFARAKDLIQSLLEQKSDVSVKPH